MSSEPELRKPENTDSQVNISQPNEEVRKSEFDYTSLSTFLTCRRKYEYRIQRGLVGMAPPTAAEFGRCIHSALDVWYLNRDLEEALKHFVEVFKADPTDDKRTPVMGCWILKNYHEKYQDQPFKVLATEQEFTIELPWHKKLIGRIDKIIEWDGVVWCMDHKTTYQLGDGFMKMHTPNMQFTGYVYAANKMGYKCQGVLVDAILVAKGLLEANSRAKLTPLRRDFAYRSSGDLEEYLRAIYDIQQDIELCETNKWWYPNQDSCTDYGECPYRKICKESAEFRERIIENDYRVEHWDPRDGEKK